MKYTLKAKQLLSTEQGAKSAGEAFEKEATPEEIELGVALGLYEQAGMLNAEVGMLNAHPQPLPEGGGNGDEGNGEDDAAQPTPNPSQREGDAAAKNKKKGGKQK